MSDGPAAFYWLSFASEEGNLGCALVEASSMEEAVTEAHRLGINPGGEVMGVEIPADALLADPESPFYTFGRDRLIPTAEVMAAGAVKVSDL